LPQCQAEFLVLLFYEVGLCGQGANGVVAISWQEIESWKRLTDKRLTTWEAETIKSMSEAYVNEVQAGRDKNRPMPYADVSEIKVKQDKAMEDFFEMLMLQQESKI
jgi:hypothetical protein